MPITLGAAQVWTNNGNGTLLINGNVTNSTFGLTVTGSSNTNISGTLGTGAGTLTKSGAGTLTLSGLSATAASNYSGATIIDQGTLAITTTSPAFTGGLTFGSAALSTNIGTLDLTSASATFGALTVRTNSASANTITIGSGRTLTTNGNVSIGANGATNVVTKLDVTGASGTWNVVSSGGTFTVGMATGSFWDAPTLDMSGLGTFSANLGSTGTMRLGAWAGSGGDAGKATVILAANSTITAGTLGIGDQGNSATNNLLSLGSGTNTLNVNTINVGVTAVNNRGFGTLNFNSSTGTVKIRAANTTGRADLNLRVVTTAATGANVTHTFDVSGHSADLLLGTVDMMNMQAVNLGTGNAFGVYTAVFKFDTGILDATTFKIGTRTGTNNIGTTFPAATVSIGDGVNNYTNSATLGAVTMATNSNTGAGSGITGILNIAGSNTTVNLSSLTVASSSSASGSSAATGAVNISGGTVTNAGGILLASDTGAGTGTVSGTLNLTGGNLTVGGNITTVGTVTSNLTLNGGTLDMGGFAIGGVGQLITSTFSAGTLKNVLQFNDGATLTKTTSGTLVLDGTNTYSGTTIVSAGKLVVNGNISTSVSTTVANNATLAGTGTVGATTIQLGGILEPGDNGIESLNTGNLTLDTGSISNFQINTSGDIADLAISSALLTFGGTLNVTNIGGPLVANDTFNLFDWNTVAGNFSAVNLPALTGGLIWQNNLLTNGTITVIPEANVAALIGGFGALALLRRRRA